MVTSGLASRLLELLCSEAVCRAADCSMRLALPQLRLRLPRRSFSMPTGIGGTGGTVSSCTSVSVIKLGLVGETCACVRSPCDGELRVNWSVESRYAGCIPKSGAWYECDRWLWKAFGISGTSSAGVVNELVDTSDGALGKPALADLCRDLERRNGDEKRRRLFCATGLSVTALAVVAGVVTGSSSREASRECAESYITYQSALRLWV